MAQTSLRLLPHSESDLSRNKTGNMYLLVGFVLFLLVSVCKGQGHITGTVGEKLTISCMVNNITHMKYVELVIGVKKIQTFDAQNKSYCNNEHMFYNHCLTQMPGAHRSNNVVTFVITKTWADLDNKMSRCFVRNKSPSIEDIPGPLNIIDLTQGENTSLTTEPPSVNPTSRITRQVNTTTAPGQASPTDTSVPCEKTDSGILIGTVVTAFLIIALLFALLIGIVTGKIPIANVRACFKKCCCCKNDVPNQEENGNALMVQLP